MDNTKDKANKKIAIIKEQIDKFDNKANILIAIVSIVFAISLSMLDIFREFESITVSYILLLIFTSLYFISFCLEMIFLIMVIYPRRKKNKDKKSLSYYLDVSSMTDDEINAWGGVDVLIAAKVIKKKGKRVEKYEFKLKDYDLQNIDDSTIRAQIRAKRDYIKDCQEKEIIINAKVNWQDVKVVINQKHINRTSESATEFIKLKEEMFKEGILSFEDAYDLAFQYIREKNLDFSGFSHKRFKYLFIDEVQDCDHQQEELIKKLFDDEKVIVQRFGDYCQAI